ncbi:hypothetical protein CDL12_21653 [Handroanthus impetiginosus]|uniref:BRCT domain-containing protein n=1 Tax=Handroanthus impetiginosus TaxID=429701 RepID=A0A2G9GKH4_9LAMI|nr:hypothetical protein CDL12_21653 [Handroanthus impetiginosus]
MLESKQILTYEDPSKTFLGVRFILVGFDSIKEDKVRSKLLEGGGVDIVNYGPGCNYVIVDKLVYDDPICIAARRDGKTLVTGLWVDHSFDIGMPVDPSSVMYRPMKDLNGIPGAKSLVVCLTGYQRQDRDDIMTMVALMGATFSKPLVANKVTHLICYKFEGEKYELAKKMKKIKLVNHQWLEDCLKAWELLPEECYSKSGYELEMEMETEAKDSEEETEDVASVGRKNVVSPQNTRVENKSSHQSPVKPGISRDTLCLGASNSLTNAGEISKIQSTPGKEMCYEKASFSRETDNKPLEMSSSYGATGSGKKSSEVPPNMHDSTVVSEKVENVLASASESSKKSPDAVSKSGGKSYLRITPKKSSLPLRLESAVNVNTPGVSGGIDMPMERIQDGTHFDGLRTPLKGTLFQPDENQTVTLSNKRKTTASRGSSKSPMSSHDPKTLMESKLATETTGVLASGSSIDGSERLVGNVSPTNFGSSLRDRASLRPNEALNISITSEDRQECNDQALQCFQEGSRKGSLSNLDVKDLPSSRGNNSTGGVEIHQSDLRSIETPFPRTNTMVEKMDGQADLNSSKLGHSGSQSKPFKKTLGSRRTIYKGSTTKRKGSINLQKDVLQNKNTIHAHGAVTMEDIENAIITENIAMDPPTTTEDRPVDDETKTSDEKGQYEFDGGCNKKQPAEVEGQHSVKGALMKEPVANSVEAENAVCNKKTELAESKSTGDAGEKKLTKGKKRPFTKSKMSSKSKASTEKVNEDGINSKQDDIKTVSANEETAELGGRTKTRPSKKLKCSDDVEKENRPATIKPQSVSNDTRAAGKVASQPVKKPPKRGFEAHETNTNSGKGTQNLEVKTEPAWFILSGHKLQRKEFQQVIRRLKGRVCRDSHHWSYQATHFIVPDPVRRTEKFFAAAASGSWILKTDYLTASHEAGKFLSEEPYEWHKKCLTEDGAINLEAPRKWRLLRERTGHGAFHGLQIVIYGECIAPPLDTLKRVVKAGDGTILATSPPYTRFLKSRIDFAIVSPGMPRVDMWVQEFLRHEVPCVVADYLVDYVCKPGYSVEKHVQYNTHSWAKKSLENLVKRVEEIDKDPKTPENCCIDNIACQMCGCRDRGDEMLICGDEIGSYGCGVGMHLDCLDPPLENVPEEDWFCPACREKRESKSLSQRSKKRPSKSKK